MEQEFENRYYQSSEIKTGWEYQSKNVARPMDIKGIGRELLWQANSLAYAVDNDEDTAIIGAIALATALSFAGVYLLLQKLNEQTEETITDDFVRQEVEQLLQEPENQMGYEEEVEQVYTQRSGMTMGGFR